MSSEFKVEIVAVGPLTKHPNADSLSCTTVNGLNVITKTGGLMEGDHAVYIPEDAVVPLKNPAFEFLRKHPEDTHSRIKAVRLRKIYSEGLLVPVSDLGIGDPPVGTDVAKELGIVKYEQPINENTKVAMKAEKAAKDPGCAPRYDMEPFLKYADSTFLDREEVVCTEKIHGCNFRAVVKDGTLYVGSHNTFRLHPRKPSKLAGFFHGLKLALFGSKKYTMKENFRRGMDARTKNLKLDPWWTIAKRLDLQNKLANADGFAVYGEVYGHVQDLTYSVPEDEVVRFAAFEVYNSREGRYLSYDQARFFCETRGIPFVPELYRGPYAKETVKMFCSGKSKLDDKTIREGFVIRRIDEANHGRASLKLVSEEYKLRKEGTEFH